MTQPLEEFEEIEWSEALPIDDRPPRQPQFEANIAVDNPSLIVDRHGVPWWVDPAQRLLIEAKAA